MGIINSSIGKKIIMATSGLFLILFLVVHLAVNLTLFFGEESFNNAVKFMKTNPIIKYSEIILFLGFIIHIVEGIYINISSMLARRVKYKYKNRNTNSTWASRNSLATGIILLIFLIIHMRDFFYEFKFGHPSISKYEIVTSLFLDPIYTSIYIIAFVFLGLHLHHGFSSAIQSMGVYSLGKKALSKKISLIYNIIICAGFF